MLCSVFRFYSVGRFLLLTQVRYLLTGPDPPTTPEPVQQPVDLPPQQPTSEAAIRPPLNQGERAGR